MNYYNEHDPKTAAWLRELIERGLIPDGVVDERSIADVQSSDLGSYTQCHFFAGIGGWPLALQLAGWPADRPVWTGSCPCQPFSVAGKGKADQDERHLWPVFAGLIAARKPSTVFGEQVASKAGREWLAGVFADLEAMGYQRAGADLCAAGVGAPHIRQRLFWVADLQSAECERQRPFENGMQGRPANSGGMVFSDSDGCEPESSTASPAGHGDSALAASFWSDFQLVACRDGKARRVPTEPLLQRVANGIPLAVDFMRNIVGELKTQIVRHAKKTDSTAIETLREMQYAFWAEAIQWDSRGRIGLLSPEILLAALCQLERELGDFEFSSSQSIIKAQEAIMLRVRKGTAKEAATCPPSRWEYAQQLAREFADALHELSHEKTLEAAQSIFDRALGFPLTTKCPARATLLRGYGNAIVPSVAAEFVKAAIESLIEQSV